MEIHARVQQRSFESTGQEAMVGLLVVAEHVHQALGEVCARHGITHDQYNVLRILRGVHPAGHPRYEITRRLIRRAPDVTRLLDRLERQGLVERVRSPEDRRLSLTRITGEGLALLEETDPEILAVHQRFAAPLSEEELREMIRMCGAMLG